MQTREEEESFWKSAWVDRRTGWHQQTPQKALVEYIDLVVPNKTETSKVFVPLCGKTVDMSWLRFKGFHVIGCELSEIAVKEFFEELKVTPETRQEKTSGKELTVYEYDHIKIYLGNFFDLPNLGEVSAVFDRAALVALPSKTRVEYAKYMVEITNCAPQILVAYEHFRPKEPPHSIPQQLVEEYYSGSYNIKRLNTCVADIADDITEVDYLLSPK